MTNEELLNGLVDKFASSFWMHVVLDPIPGAAPDVLKRYHYVLHVNAPGDVAFQSDMETLAKTLNPLIAPYTCEYRPKFGIFCTIFSSTHPKTTALPPCELIKHMQISLNPPQKPLSESTDTLFSAKKRNNLTTHARKKYQRKTT